MYLKSLGLEQFRCYARADIELGPGLNVFVGSNASGKTSLLEAIYLLAVTKSHRTAVDRDLIRWEEGWSRVQGVFRTQERRDTSLRITLWRKGNGENGSRGPRKTIEVNAVPKRRPAEIIGQAAVVLFGPDDLALVKGGPSLRRHFLNAGIAQARPLYLSDLMRYRRALRQRNECLRLIRQGLAGPELLPGWDAQLAESGARIATARWEFVQALAPHVNRIQLELSGGKESVETVYHGDLAEAVDVDSRRVLLRELLTQSLERDVVLGRTQRGPHRDEVELLLEGRSLRQFGSQGQQRTTALSLTLAQAAVMQQWRKESPVILLDDCLSELDEDRARKVLQLTESVEQVIVSTASWDRLLEEYASKARVFEVGEGQVRERGETQ